MKKKRPRLPALPLLSILIISFSFCQSLFSGSSTKYYYHLYHNKDFGKNQRFEPELVTGNKTILRYAKIFSMGRGVYDGGRQTRFMIRLEPSRLQLGEYALSKEDFFFSRSADPGFICVGEIHMLKLRILDIDEDEIEIHLDFEGKCASQSEKLQSTYRFKK
jgi:hypothetical protein